MSSVAWWSPLFFSFHLGICSGMNVCSYAWFVFTLENRRVKETRLMLELKLICLWNKLPQETKFIKQTLKKLCFLQAEEGGREKYYTSCRSLRDAWLLKVCACMCFRDIGEKALLTEYTAGEGEKGTSWMEVLFVKGSPHCYWTNSNSFGHLRNLKLPGSFHVPCWNPALCFCSIEHFSKH